MDIKLMAKITVGRNLVDAFFTHTATNTPLSFQEVLIINIIAIRRVLFYFALIVAGTGTNFFNLNRIN